MLAGIIPAPSRYSPYRTPDMVLHQRDRVLRRMLEERFITAGRLRAGGGAADPGRHRSSPRRFRPLLRRGHPQVPGDRPTAPTTLYEGGLQVQTTLDPQIQKAAENAIHAGLLKLDHRRGWRGADRRGQGRRDRHPDSSPPGRGGKPVIGRWYQGLVLAAGAKTRRGEDRQGDLHPRPRGDRLDRPPQPGRAAEARRRRLVPLRVSGGQDAGGEAEDAGDARSRTAADGGAGVPSPGSTSSRSRGSRRRRWWSRTRPARCAALVGGWDFDRNQFNRITQAHRQVGSSFKPFVYGAALEAGWTPADTLLDAPTSFIGADGKLSYRPENYYHKHYGIVTLRRALEQSINVPAVKLFELVGGKKVVDFAHRTGLQTPLPTWPSIALGAADLVPLEVAVGLCHDRQRRHAHRALPDREGDDPGRPGPDAALPRHLHRHHAGGLLRARPHDEGGGGARHGVRHPRPADRHRRQDRDDQRLLGRLVRRLHPALHHPHLGGLRREALARRRHERRRRRPPDVADDRRGRPGHRLAEEGGDLPAAGRA